MTVFQMVRYFNDIRYKKVFVSLSRDEYFFVLLQDVNR